MNLRFLHGKINTNYAWELQSFYNYRDLKDGIDFIEFECRYDKYITDHNPRFEIGLKMFNFIIFTFSIYNVWHTDNPHSPYFGCDNEIWDEAPKEWDKDGDTPNYEKDNL